MLGALVRRVGQRMGYGVVVVEQFACVRQARCNHVKYRRVQVELRLLRHVDRGELVLPCDEAVVRLREARDNFQQRRLARAITADQSDAFTGFKRKICVIEQRNVAERELRVRN